jgi:hypothetical protein
MAASLLGGQSALLTAWSLAEAETSEPPLG